MRFVRGAVIGLLAACLPISAIGCASMSQKLNVMSSISRHRTESQYQAARTAEQRGQLEKARELYAALQLRSPNSPEYAHRMGVVCTQLQDYVTAGKYFQHARGLDPQNADLLADMGYAAYLQRDYRSAEAYLSDSVRIRSGDARAVNNLAMAVGFQGRYDESLALFRRVNTETQALLNLAFVQSQKNEPETAMATYQRVLAQEPGNKVANGALQQLHASLQRTPLASQAAQMVAQVDRQSQPFETSIVPQEAVEDTRPVLIVQGATTPQGDVETPLIQPFGEHWAATPASPKAVEDAAVAASSEFELPRPVGPPAELGEEPVAVASTTAATSATDDLVSPFSEGDNAPETPITGSDDLAGLDWAQADLAKQKAAVQSGEKPAPLQSDWLQGNCPVALRDERRLAPALDEFTAEFQAQIYRFSSAQARDAFLAHPEWYVPAAGGLDIIQVRGGDTTQGSLDHACWFRHRLHMFSTAENLAAFRAAPRDYVSNP